MNATENLRCALPVIARGEQHLAVKHACSGRAQVARTQRWPERTLVHCNEKGSNSFLIAEKPSTFVVVQIAEKPWTFVVVQMEVW